MPPINNNQESGKPSDHLIVLMKLIGTSVWRCSQSQLGGRLATMLVVTISVIIFLFSSLLQAFLIEGVL